MATKVKAQETLMSGSFVIATTSSGELKKNKLYRVKDTKEDGRYITLDHDFCGTDKLKGKTISFEGRFLLLSEEETKSALKELIKQKGFVTGESFTDVRNGETINIQSDSRVNALVKFEKFMGLKIAGGHIWFAGKGWAVSSAPEKKEEGFPEQKEEKPKTKKEKFNPSTTTFDRSMTIEEQILGVVTEFLASKDAQDHVANTAEELLNRWGIDKNVRQLEVSVNKQPPVKVGKVHFKYDLVLKCMMARTNVALVGAAGSGKTTTVAKAAEALKLKFYSKSVSAQTGAHEFFGYQDAQGRYVRTLFREAYEHGGVFLLDEFDAGNPNVLAALNQATANQSCAFADGMIPKHEDFICVMAGNTFGHGANSEYVGRNKIDAATLDRFAFIDFPYDEDLEYALAPNKDWCKKVQAYRRKVESKKIKTIISPRATLIGGQLLANGVSEKEVLELVIFKGMNEAERDLMK